MTSRGNGYLASDALKTSTSNQELVPLKPLNWSFGYKIRKLSFDNAEQECRVIVVADGKTTTAFLKAGQGFEMGYDDPPITSFKIVESNIKYTWIATF